jgi:hypothetical protein
MGEVEGKGILIRGGEVGVVGSGEDSDIVDPDDTDETETERGLLRLVMGMGRGLVDFSLEAI